MQVTSESESFPRQRARTRGFRLGAPRGFAIRRTESGDTRVVFLRSADGRTAAGDLWVAESSQDYRDRLVVSAIDVGESSSNSQVPAAELARRERSREVTEGITSYSLDASGTFAAFALDGTAYRANLDDGSVVALTRDLAVVDPRISPDGRFVAFVADSRIHLSDVATGTLTCISPDEDDTVTWGLADFIAAEELERHRGMWWLPDSSGLLAERVDESGVAVRWIGDPARPEREPTAHRYPAAGTTNAAVSLHRLSLDGAVTDLAWDTNEYCYLQSVNVPTNGAPTVTVLSRDQQRQRVFQVADDSLVTIADRSHSPWVTVIPGVPSLSPREELIEVLADDDCFRLTRNGSAVTPPDINIEAVLDIGEEAAIVQAYEEPTARFIAEVNWDGFVRRLSTQPGWNAAVAESGVLVELTTDLDSLASRARIVDGDRAVSVESFAETPCLRPRPRIHVVGSRELRSAVVLPSSHEPGLRWPVICSPYGGPHAQRVLQAGQAYLTEQWLADQGFAVVITDGRGTPGRGPMWEYAVHGDLAGPVLQDQVDALEALAEKIDALDTTRVGIRGWSFGGYLAALAVLDRPNVFHAAVAGAPVTDWRLYDTAYTERYLGNPNDDASAYERTTLLTRAPELTRPLLLIHGLADDNVLAAHTLQMSSALLAAGRPHNVLPLSGVTHMTPQEVIAENLLLTEVGFFRTHLG